MFMEAGGFMIELPFTLKIDFVINKDVGFYENIFCTLLSEMREISPCPVLEIFLYNIDYYENISGFLKDAGVDAVLNFYYNEELKKLPDSESINLLFPLNTPDLYKKIRLHKNRAYNLVLVPSSGFDKKQKAELNKVKQDFEIKNLFLKPYMTEYELDKFAHNILNRQFLTCAAAWLNPVIDCSGDVYCCKYNKIGNISNQSLLDIWNNSEADKVRQKIVSEKNIKHCSSCLKKYFDAFLVVDNAELDYKGKKYLFPSVINYVVSAPKLVIAGQKTAENKYLAEAYPVFSDEDIVSAEKQILLLLG